MSWLKRDHKPEAPSMIVNDDARAEHASKDVRKRVLIVTVAFAAIVIGAYYMFSTFLTDQIDEDMMYMYPGILGSAICFYCGRLIHILLSGKLSVALTNGFNVLTAAILSSLLLLFAPASPDNVWIFSVSIIVAGLAAVTAYVVRVYSEHLWLVARAVVIMLIGVALEIGIGQWSDFDQLSGVPIASMIVIALLSTIGAFKDHSNIAVRWVGNYFRKTVNLISLLILLVIIFLYVFSLRADLVESAPDQTMLIEWGLVGITAGIVLFQFYKYFKKDSTESVYGDWTKLVQTITYDKGMVVQATWMVEEFVERGNKEPLIAMVTRVLYDGRAELAQTANIIAELVRYTEVKPTFTFTWLLGDAAETRRIARLELANRTLGTVATLLGATHLLKDDAVLEG